MPTTYIRHKTSHLNPNQQLYHEKLLIKALHARLDALEKRDQYYLLKRALKVVAPDLFKKIPPEPEYDNEDLDAAIKRTITENISDGNPNLLRVAMDFQSELAGRKYIGGLTVIIEPYEIADKSLRNIVLDAGDNIIAEIDKAREERRLMKSRESSVA